MKNQVTADLNSLEKFRKVTVVLVLLTKVSGCSGVASSNAFYSPGNVSHEPRTLFLKSDLATLLSSVSIPKNEDLEVRLQLMNSELYLEKGKREFNSDLSEIEAVMINGKLYFVAIRDKANPAVVNIYEKNERGLFKLNHTAEILDQAGNIFLPGTLDAESIRFFKDKGNSLKAIITSEGDSVGYDQAKSDGAVPIDLRKRDPKIYLCDVVVDQQRISAVKVQKELKYPDRFLHQVKIDPTDSKITIDLAGSRANGSFESAAVVGRILYLISELPLVEDGDVPDMTKGGICRMLAINIENEEISEYAYEVEKVSVSDVAKGLIAEGAIVANQENGVVSIFQNPTRENSFFVLERSFLKLMDHVNQNKVLHTENNSRIYEIKITEITSRVGAIERLKKNKILPLEKREILNFNELGLIFKEQKVSPNNFEGMSIRFDESKDAWEIVFVSDNNSNPEQGATQFLTISIPDR